MTENFAGLFGLLSEAVFVIGGGSLVYSNVSARRLLPGIDSLSPEDIFPRSVLMRDADNFVGEIVISGRLLTYSASRLGDYRVFYILPRDGEEEDSKVDIFAAVSSEMKNHLAVLHMAAGILLSRIEGMGDERLSEYSSMLYHSYFNILRLISNVEVLGGAPENAGGAKKKTFDLIRECRMIADTCSHLISDKGIEISFSSAEESIMFAADKDRIQQMLLNVISNSVINLTSGGRITLSAALSGGNVLLVVSDTGSGIPDSEQATAWHRFSAPRDGTDARRGAGFGLAAVAQIAQQHGGSAFFESREGEGTTVAITLPYVRDETMSFNQEIIDYRSGGIQSFLTGLATAIGSDKYTRKYMD